jgi:TRAP-type C4-dicarboxylate transport system substrate-binding protein
MSPDEQKKFQKAADDAIAWSTQKHLDREKELASVFEEKGLKIYKPDVDAFREYAQKMYLASDLAKDWPEGMLDKINAL